jgi:hypothetical protein
LNPREIALLSSLVVSGVGGVGFSLSFAYFGVNQPFEGVLLGVSIGIVTALMLGLTDPRDSRDFERNRVAVNWLLIANTFVGSAQLAISIGIVNGFRLGALAGAGAAVLLLLAFGPGMVGMQLIGRRVRRPLSATGSGVESPPLRLRLLVGQLYNAIIVAAVFALPIAFLNGTSRGWAFGWFTFGDNLVSIALLCILLSGLGLIGRRGVPERVSLRLRGRTRSFARAVRAGLSVGISYGAIIAASFSSYLVVEYLVYDMIRHRPLALTKNQAEFALIVAGLAEAVGLASGLSREFTQWLKIPVDLVASPTPMEVMRRSRGAGFTWAVFSVVVLEVMAVLGTVAPNFGLPGELAVGLSYGIPIGIIGVTLALIGTVWGEFVLVKTWLAIKGVAPMALVGFLVDARARGVLRSAGAVFQFRHLRLQDMLVSKAVGASTKRATVGGKDSD